MSPFRPFAAAVVLFASILAWPTLAIGSGDGDPDDRADAPATWCATSRWLDDYRAGMAASLAASSEARSLLVAALQRQWQEVAPRCGDPQPTSDALMARALEAAPADLLVLHVAAARHCGKETSACPADAAIERLKALDPDNAGTWLRAFELHHRRGDAAGARTALARAATATSYHDFYSDLFREVLTRTLADPTTIEVPPGEMLPWDLRTHVRFFRWNDAQATSGISMLVGQGLAAACDPESAARGDDQLQADCHAIGLRLADDGSALQPRTLGLFLAYLATRDPAERTALEERWRSMEWLRAQVSGFETARVDHADAAWVEAGIAASLATPGYFERLRGVAAAEGIPLAPPSDWQPTRTLAMRVDALRRAQGK